MLRSRSRTHCPSAHASCGLAWLVFRSPDHHQRHLTDHSLDARLKELVEAADINALLHAVDGSCASKEWEELEDLAELCMDAIERGKQLWPITAHIDYRLALEAPAEYAAAVLDSDLGRFSVGPLTEVAASTHTWDEIADHIETPQAAAYVAQERVLRGEDLSGDERAHPEVVDLPLRLKGFEPTYTLALFRANSVEIPEPWDPKKPMSAIEVRAVEETNASLITDTLLDIVTPWVAESNGAARACVVEGSYSDAIGTLTEGVGEIHAGELQADEALQRIAWAAASGGAHGRRRGAVFGRFTAFYVATVLAGGSWPAPADEVDQSVKSLRWFRWDEGAHEEGWVLRLAIEHPEQGWAAALAATDLKLEEERDL